MVRGGWQYQEEVSPSTVNHVWKVIAVMVASTAAVLASGAVLPRDRPVDWSWLGPGLAILVGLVGALGVLAGRTRARSGYYAPPPPVALALGLVALAGLTLISIGASGPFAIYRELIVVPAIVVLAFGNRLIVYTISAATLVAVVGAGIAQGLPLSVVPAMAVAYAFGWGGVIAIIHMVEFEATQGMQRHRLLAQMASTLVSADDLDQGLAVLLPLVGDLLEASAVEVRAFERPAGGGPTDAGTVIARWTRADGVVPHVPAAAEAHAALGLDRPVVHDDHALVPMPSGDAHRPLLAVVTADAPDVRNRLRYEHDLDQARVQLDLLASRTRLLSELAALSRTDGLTGLANHRTLLERLDHECQAARRHGGDLTVVMLDVDHFKDFNDTFGHLAGDEALVAVAAMLRERLRATDLPCRYGGEEFCLVLPATATARAAEIVTDLHARCRRLRAPRPLTFSAGIAQWLADESPEELLDRADRALYQAKVNGRDQTWAAGTGRIPWTSVPKG